MYKKQLFSHFRSILLERVLAAKRERVDAVSTIRPVRSSVCVRCFFSFSPYTRATFLVRFSYCRTFDFDVSVWCPRSNRTDRYRHLPNHHRSKCCTAIFKVNNLLIFFFITKFVRFCDPFSLLCISTSLAIVSFLLSFCILSLFLSWMFIIYLLSK